MRIHYLQHEPFEDLANIAVWAAVHHHSLSGTHLYKGSALPDHDTYDFLIILGGGMNIYEEDQFPWLSREKSFIESAINQQKLVLGICLGAQLIAAVLGGTVSRNHHKEIGWFPVQMIPRARSSNAWSVFPGSFMAFHWHGDTFSLPPKTEHICSSSACQNQAFDYDHGRVVGLQVDIESNTVSIENLTTNCVQELVGAPYIQSIEAITSGASYIPAMSILLTKFMNTLVARVSS